jgi:hypothetical protein
MKSQNNFGKNSGQNSGQNCGKNSGRALAEVWQGFWLEFWQEWRQHRRAGIRDPRMVGTILWETLSCSSPARACGRALIAGGT